VFLTVFAFIVKRFRVFVRRCLTITVTGAVVGDEVMMALPAAPTAGLVFNALFPPPTRSLSTQAISRVAPLMPLR
jgi:hypothetical protein